MRQFADHAAGCYCKPCENDRRMIRELADFVCYHAPDDNQDAVCPEPTGTQCKCGPCQARDMILKAEV